MCRLRFQLLPVNPFKKCMALDLVNILCPQSIHKILTQQPLYKVICFFTDHPLLLPNLRPLNIKLQNIVQHFLNRIPAKRPHSNQYLIRYHSQTPPVNTPVIYWDAVYDLRRDIVRCADDFGLWLSCDHSCTSSAATFVHLLLLFFYIHDLLYLVLQLDLWESKISQFQVSPFINDQILRLQVSVNNVRSMQVLNGKHNLGNHILRPFLFKIHFLLKHFTQIPTGHELHHKDVHCSLAKTVRCLDQMLTCYFLEYLVLIANLLKLLRSPVLVDIDHFQRV